MYLKRERERATPRDRERDAVAESAFAAKARTVDES